MQVTLADLSYEAAINGERWPEFLESLREEFCATSAELFVVHDADQKPHFHATSLTRHFWDRSINEGRWQTSLLSKALQSNVPEVRPGVFRTFNVAQGEYLECEAAAPFFLSPGIREQLTVPVSLPMGEAAFYCVEWQDPEEAATERALDGLAELSPHLTRAAQVAARLQLQSSVSVVAAFECYRLPAAVVSSTGKIKAANANFQALAYVTIGSSDNRLHISSPSADRLLMSALQEIDDRDELPNSIGFNPGFEKKPLVFHVLPLRKSVGDVFNGASALVVACEISMEQVKTAPSLLRDLFDLSPSEARLATEWARSSSLADAACRLGLKEKTARTYLERIFQKTGCNRQIDLALLISRASF